MLEEKSINLTTEVEYASKGETEKAKMVIIRPPTSRHINECSILKQCFFRAARSFSDGKEKAEKKETNEDDLTAEDVMQMMYSSDIDITEVISAIRKLFKKGVLFFDGEVVATDPLMEKLSIDDFQTIAGEYLVNFILASALQKMNQN